MPKIRTVWKIAIFEKDNHKDKCDGKYKWDRGSSFLYLRKSVLDS